MDAPTPFLVPRLNVNDDTVVLVKWSVPQDARVSAGEVVCEVETSKATSEVTAQCGGVLVQVVPTPTRVGVGEEIGVIGSSREAIDAFLAARRTPDASGGPIRATPRARTLAEASGVSLEDVAAAGVRGAVKETDVRRFLSARSSDGDGLDQALPAGLDAYVMPVARLSAAEVAVATSLGRSTRHLILTSVDADCDVTAAQTLLRSMLASGRMVSLLHLAIAAVGKTLNRYPRLMSFAHDGTVYQYRHVDIAFVARTVDGRLYTPVIRAADRDDLQAIATAGQALAFRVMRGTIRAEELEGGCFTISHVAVPGTTRVAALPSFGQSAVLGVSAERASFRIINGAIAERSIVTLTLSYDHTLCDGTYAAAFLADVIGAVDQIGESPSRHSA